MNHFVPYKIIDSKKRLEIGGSLVELWKNNLVEVEKWEKIIAFNLLLANCVKKRKKVKWTPVSYDKKKKSKLTDELKEQTASWEIWTLDPWFTRPVL